MLPFKINETAIGDLIYAKRELICKKRKEFVYNTIVNTIEQVEHTIGFELNDIAPLTPVPLQNSSTFAQCFLFENHIDINKIHSFINTRYTSHYICIIVGSFLSETLLNTV